MKTLLAILGFSQHAYSKWLFQRLLSGILIITGLTIILAVIVSAVLVAGLAALYFSLLYYGIGQLMALAITALLALMLIAALFSVIYYMVRRLQKMPRSLLRNSSLTARAMDTLDAFTDGLMAE